MLDNSESCVDTVRIRRLEECTIWERALHSRWKQVGYFEGNHDCSQINKRRTTDFYGINECKQNWWLGSSTSLLPWLSQAQTTGMIPINLRHCLLSSSFSLYRTSNSRSGLGRSFALGSDRMAGHPLITNFCSELGRQSLGRDWMAGQ